MGKETMYEKAIAGMVFKRKEEIMKVTLYYNQYCQGGAVESELWQLRDGNKIDTVYGSVEALRSVEIELPEGYSIGKDFAGDEKIYFNDYEVQIGGNYNKIYAINGVYDFPHTLWTAKG